MDRPEAISRRSSSAAVRPSTTRSSSLRAARAPRERRLRRAQRERERNELLLRAVVQVAFDPAPGRVGRGHDRAREASNSARPSALAIAVARSSVTSPPAFEVRRQRLGFARADGHDAPGVLSTTTARRPRTVRLLPAQRPPIGPCAGRCSRRARGDRFGRPARSRCCHSRRASASRWAEVAVGSCKHGRDPVAVVANQDAERSVEHPCHISFRTASNTDAELRLGDQRATRRSAACSSRAARAARVPRCLRLRSRRARRTRPVAARCRAAAAARFEATANTPQRRPSTVSDAPTDD